MASASDNFNRANGNIGANWTTTAGSWTVSSSAANQTTVTGSYWSAVYTATPPATNDCYSAASMRSNNTATGAGVCVRASSTARTFYGYSGYGGDAFYLEYLNAGASTIIDTGAVCTASTTYFLRVQASGTTISGSVNGTADVSATHATLTTGGWGLAAYGEVTGANSWIDTWDAADLSAGGAMTATMPFSFAQSGTATGTGALTGNNGAVFAQSGTALALGYITASNPFAFSQSGTATGTGALLGTDAATFSQSGTLAGSGALTASMPFAFAQAATLGGLGGLVASVPFVFDQLGTATDGTPPAGALAGVLPWAFSQAGTLTGTGALLGTDATTFAQAGTLTGYGALSVSMAFIFDQAGTLTDGTVPPSALAGVIPFAFGQAGTLTGVGGLSAAVPFVFAEAATLTGTGALAGVIPFVFTAVYGDNSGVGPGTRYLYLSQARRTAFGNRDNAPATKRQSAKSEG